MRMDVVNSGTGLRILKSVRRNGPSEQRPNLTK